MKTRLLPAFLALAVTLGVALPAAAQDSSGDGDSGHAKLPDRGGFFIGFGFGGGSLGVEDADERETGGVAHLRIGGALNQTVLLAGESVAWVKEFDDGSDITSTAVVGAAYIYPSRTSTFYLKGGVGLARLEITAAGLGSASDDGTAFIVGAGFDIGFGGRFALTPQFDFIRSGFDGGSTNVAQLQLGLTWY